MIKTFSVLILLLLSAQTGLGQSQPAESSQDSLRYLNIPARAENALSGSQFVAQVTGMSIMDREKAVLREIMSGNVPSFARKLRPLQISQTINNQNYDLV
jgi:hypothetical protein